METGAGTPVVLAGDIGGTKTELASFAVREGALELTAQQTFRSAEHDSFEEILRRFVDGAGATISAACFGVAGAVIDGRVRATNLPWVLDEKELAGVCGAGVSLINDLAATAYGMLELDASARATLNAGQPRLDNVAVVAAGTGLGEALLYWDGERHRAVSSEGGHAQFAPRGDEQIELLRFLRAELGHVSTERVLSGPGLHNIYRFARARGGDSEPGWLADRLASEDPSAVISELALAGRDSVCEHSLELFVSIYGAEAGDLALRYLALGGVYLGGGIAPKILPALRRAAFWEAFCDKGRFSDLVSRVPVHVALEPRAALFGAARHAAAQV